MIPNIHPNVPVRFLWPIGGKPPESPCRFEPNGKFVARIEGIQLGGKAGTKDKLVDGIEQFWMTVSRSKCQKYIHVATTLTQSYS